MIDIEPGKKFFPYLLYLSLSCAIFTSVLSFTNGPRAMILCSGTGLLLSLGDIIKRLSRKEGLLLTSIMLGTHALFLVVAAILAFFFLVPLSSGALHMPKLTQHHSDLNGKFQIRLPADWELEPLHADREVGVRAHPRDRSEYMGVVELTIRVRMLDKPQKADGRFFEKMASTLTLTPSQKKRLFDFHTKPTVLLDNSPGLWSYLVLHRFWIPLYQTSLFGLQKGRYLCSVATSGIKSHDTLAEVLCLGVMESIQIEKPLKNPPESS